MRLGERLNTFGAMKKTCNVTSVGLEVNKGIYESGCTNGAVLSGNLGVERGCTG